MRIGIGALLGITGGPATYARELTAALARAGGHEYVVFTDRPDYFAGCDLEVQTIPLRHVVEQVVWDHWQLPARIAAARVALYHGTKNVLPWRLPVPGIVTVHDLAPYRMPETFARVQRWHFRLTVPNSVRRAAHVLADSLHARDDLMQLFGVPAERITTVPLGVTPSLLAPVPAAQTDAFARRHQLGERVIACVGTIQPRKHVERVVDAFAASGAAADGWRLAIAGRIRPGYTPPWLHALPAGAVFLGSLSDADLHALYGAATIAMNASDYEGFGLTVCEAMAQGCAVVAVGVTSVPEVVGDAGILVPRSDAGLLTAALRELLIDPVRRAALSERARERAATFTWETAARRTRAVYEAVAAEAPR